MGGARVDRRPGDRGRGGRPARLPPPHVQRTHRSSRGGARAARRPLLGSARHLRLPRGPHHEDPPGHPCARARLPPPAGDREALRHPRCRERRAADPRGRGRQPRGRVRPHRRTVRRPREPGRRRAAGPASVAVAARARVPRRALRLRGLRDRPVRRAATRPHLGRRPHLALATPSRDARRRLESLRRAAPRRHRSGWPRSTCPPGST